MNYLEVKNLAEWHDWLAKNHSQVNEVWLVYRKFAGGLRYEESIEEALCFGWVDSLIKNLDVNSHARKFTPRRSGSRWSALNISRAERMIAQGRMTGIGLKLFEESKSQPEPALTRKEQMEIFREDLVERLDAETLMRFNLLPPSLQGQYAGWVMSGKKEETRQKRVEELSETLARGERLGLK